MLGRRRRAATRTGWDPAWSAARRRPGRPPPRRGCCRPWPAMPRVTAGRAGHTWRRPARHLASADGRLDPAAAAGRPVALAVRQTPPAPRRHVRGHRAVTAACAGHLPLAAARAECQLASSLLARPASPRRARRIRTTRAGESGFATQVKTKAVKANHRARRDLCRGSRVRDPKPSEPACCAGPSRTSRADPPDEGNEPDGVESVERVAPGRPGISSSNMALSVPVTTKTTKSGENGRLAYAVSAMQGFRENMEDAHTAVLQLDAATATSFFGVYDGHGGPAVARYCGKHLHVELQKHPQFRSHPITALEETFLRMDEKMRRRKAGKELSGYGGNEYWDGYREALHGQCFRLPICGEKPPYEGPLNDGCTAIVVLIRDNDIIVGNAGDSRCVLSRNNQPVVLSTDFKPDLPGERQRIENAGRAVTTTEARGNIPRIDAGIAVSRTLGDLAYKNNANLPAREQAITALPEVRTEYINNDAQFLILACDGIWDCMTNQQAVDYVRIKLAADAGLAFTCESILDHCIALPRGRDNMTVMLVRFKTTGTGQASSSNVPPPLPPLQQAIVLPARGHGDQVLPAASAAGEAWRAPREPTSTSSGPATPNWGSAAAGRTLPTVRGGSRTNSSKSSDRSSKSSEL